MSQGDESSGRAVVRRGDRPPTRLRRAPTGGRLRRRKLRGRTAVRDDVSDETVEASRGYGVRGALSAGDYCGEFCR